MKTQDVKENNVKNEKVKLQLHPLTLSINDLIWIITAVVSIVVAWGMYGSRITVLEVNQLTTNKEIAELKNELSKQKDENVARDKKILELQLKNHISPRD